MFALPEIFTPDNEQSDPSSVRAAFAAHPHANDKMPTSTDRRMT
jgi:hypothetical protein